MKNTCNLACCDFIYFSGKGNGVFFSPPHFPNLNKEKDFYDALNLVDSDLLKAEHF